MNPIEKRSSRRAMYLLLSGTMLTGAALWLLDPKRRQPPWIGRLLLRLHPDGRYFQWHVRRVVAANKERDGQMRARDYLRVVRIGEKTGNTISDSDLKTLLRLLNAPSRYPQIVHGHVIARLLDVPRFSEPQKDWIFRAVSPLLSLQNPDDFLFLHQQQGMKMMKHLGDPRAIPLIVPLLNHSREKVRLKAEDALAALGRSPDSRFD